MQSTKLRRPHFDNPPLIEVVCGVQFSGAERWRTSHIGSFWERIRAEYPDVEDQPQLDRIDLDPQTRAGVAEVVVPLLPPLRRVFFIQPPGNFLAQLQPGRLLHNWRKVNQSEEYPRFEKIYGKFMEMWAELQKFSEEMRLGPMTPEALELTYISHISRDGARFPRDAKEFLAFPLTTAAAPDPAIGQVGRFMVQMAWPLLAGHGWLNLDLKHGVRSTDSQEVIAMELTARTKVEQNMEVAHWFEVAHGAIVTTFDTLTTARAHELWGKQS